MRRRLAAFPGSPPSAIGWAFWRRHRWGLVALAGYPVILSAMKVIVTMRGEVVSMSSQRFGFGVIVPTAAAFMYVLAVFTYSLSGDLAARRSTYPARLFTLPVSTAALAGWPMVYGCTAALLLWLATRASAIWPSQFTIPWIWPGLLAAASVAWIQALTWMPYGLRGVRIAVVILWLTLNDVIVISALVFHASESVMAAILAPQLPLAFFVARFGIARARRGDVPDWSRPFSRLGTIVGAVARRNPPPFRSPEHAQAWLEWRQHGWSLPTWVVILLPTELVLLFADRGSSPITFAVVFAALVTPAFLASFVAAGVRRSSANITDSHGLTPFLATRPMSGPALIAAKLSMAFWSTLAAWAVVAVFVPAALIWSGSWPAVSDEAHRAVVIFGLPRAVVLLAAPILGLVATTWKQLVQALYVGLTGRDWFVKLSVFLTIVFFSLLAVFIGWLADHARAQAALWDAIPWILGTCAIVKVSAAMWIAVRLYDSRLLTDRVLVTGAGLWCGAVLVLYGLFAWFFDTPFVPHDVLLFVAILAVPLVRLSAAPLVLAWNRHR